MNKIDVLLVDPNPAQDLALMSLAAKVSKEGHKWKTAQDVIKAAEQPVTDKRFGSLLSLPHPTLQKFSTITLIFRGVSRRFLAQITRHQNEIKFMSSSFRQADHSNDIDFVIPLEMLRTNNGELIYNYKLSQMQAITNYKELVSVIGRDAAAYALPQSIRTTIMASATPYQWKHIIGQRTCYKCALEMQYVMLLAWASLYRSNPAMFSPAIMGRACDMGACREGKDACGRGIITGQPPEQRLKHEFPELDREDDSDVSEI
jgi:thymidylate synthase (FAD)